MDRVTDKVRAFYEAFPYPPGDRVDCDGYQADLLLSYRECRFDPGQPLQVLEAGCGRGLNLQAAAAAQPHARFTGIDINRVAIDEARQAAAEKHLENLQFQTADLMQPDSLPWIPGGYDLILSYGVIHHLSDPLSGLRSLRKLLSPRGLVALMVDGRFGRQPLDRFLQALGLLRDPSLPDTQRLAEARALARVAEAGLFRGTHWQGTAEADDVEFADRCLHVHERSYTVEALWELLGSAGLGFLRWVEPADWCLPALEADPLLSPQLSRLSTVQRYQLVERLCERPKLMLVALPEGAEGREPLCSESVPLTLFALNPQLKPQQASDGERHWQLRGQPAAAAGSEIASAILRAADAWGEAFTGEWMIGQMDQQGTRRQTVLETLCRLETREWLYRPHPRSLGSDR